MNGVTTKPTQAINQKAAGTLKTMPRYSRTAEDVDLSEEAELRRLESGAPAATGRKRGHGSGAAQSAARPAPAELPALPGVSEPPQPSRCSWPGCVLPAYHPGLCSFGGAEDLAPRVRRRPASGSSQPNVGRDDDYDGSGSEEEEDDDDDYDVSGSEEEEEEARASRRPPNSRSRRAGNQTPAPPLSADVVATLTSMMRAQREAAEEAAGSESFKAARRAMAAQAAKCPPQRWGRAEGSPRPEVERPKTRFCRICQQDLPVEKFNLRERALCIACTREYRRQRWLKEKQGRGAKPAAKSARPPAKPAAAKKRQGRKSPRRE